MAICDEQDKTERFNALRTAEALKYPEWKDCGLFDEIVKSIIRGHGTCSNGNENVKNNTDIS